MYIRWACVSFLYPLLLSSVLTASATPPPGAKPSTSNPESPDSILLQQQNSSPSSPLSILLLKNTTLSAPNPTATIDPTIVPIPGTDTYLRITYIGSTWFETSLLETLISGACAKIADAVFWHPNESVAPLPWFYQSYSKQWRDTIAIRVRGNEGKVVTWQQFDWVLAALLHFMEGEPMQLHPVNFDVNVVGKGMVAAGVLWHSQRPAFREVERAKRGLR